MNRQQDWILKNVLILEILLSEMSKDKIIIISTHIVSDIEYISDQVLIMKKGKFILQGPADELLKEVKMRYGRVECLIINGVILKGTHCIANSHVMKEVIEARVISTSSPIEGAINCRTNFGGFVFEAFF